MEIKEILQNQESQAAMKQLMSDEIMNLIHENMKPRDTIMAYYRCAIMEVETKFKALWKPLRKISMILQESE